MMKTMRRALLIGVEDEHPDQRFRPAPSLAAMEVLLGELGDWTITRVEGLSATRENVLAALASLEGAVGPDDTCLLYFVGHGGIVEIRDVGPPLGRRPVFYIAAARPARSWTFEAICDIELSLCLARIDRVCCNVTAILDCCYSARTIRGDPAWPLYESPDWLRDLAEQLRDVDFDDLLSPTSHPRIVRLAASSSLRTTFPEVRANGHLGRLTRLFVEVVREAELRIDRLTWDAVAHRVRERAIWLLGCEEQWVTLSGPRQRLLFSRLEAALPRTVGFVPRETGIGGWIRAGELQGVRVGDEWGLAELVLDDQLRPRWRSRMRVVATDLNRAELEHVIGDDSAELGTSAHLLCTRRAAKVIVDGPEILKAAVARSAWLSLVGGADAAAEMLSLRDEIIEARSAGGEFAAARFSHDERGLAAAIQRLEDWTRARLLLAIAGARDGAERSPIAVRWGRYLDRGTRQDMTREAMPRLHVGDRVHLRIAAMAGSVEWFVCAIGIDVAGRPMLLDASEPDGRELLGGETADIGWHAHRQLQGLESTWPEGVSADQPRSATIVILASRRPIQLGHLVHGSVDDGLPRDMARRTRARARGHLARPRPRTGPEPAYDWAAKLIRYELDPQPRASAAARLR